MQGVSSRDTFLFFCPLISFFLSLLRFIFCRLLKSWFLISRINKYKCKKKIVLLRFIDIPCIFFFNKA